jgi:spore germination protein KC
MIRKKILILIILLHSLLVSGCWNYIGLDEITIVAGIAIDKNNDNNRYHLSFEIIDLVTSNKEEGVKTTIVESEGTTIFDAIRNAKKRITNKLYFGNAQIVIISEQIAKEEGILGIVNWLIRDAEPREDLNIVISKEATAKDLISLKGIGDPITSYEIRESVSRDNKVTASTINIELYKIFNILTSQKEELAIPAFKSVENHDIETVEVDGVAVFYADKLIGYLDSDETKYFLFATNNVQGGILTLDTTKDDKDNISLELVKSKTKATFKEVDSSFKFNISIELDCYLGEDSSQTSSFKDDDIQDLQKEAQKKLDKEVTKIIKKIIEDYNTDILGFGKIIYKKNPKLWEDISGNWKNIIKDVDIEVKSKIKIVNSAFIK